MTNEIKKQWEELKKKHTLPDFKLLDLDFDIGSIEETDFPTKAVVGKIAEKIEFFIGLLSDILQPEPSNIYAMHETRFFDEDEKKAVYQLYTKLMTYSRRCLELSLMNSQKDDAEFISLFYEEWQSTKQELLGFIHKMRQSWSIEGDIKEDLGYLG